MNLLFVYGPPGVGKLTVSKELARKTGYKLFHNHLTIAMIESVFDRDIDQVNRLSSKIRLIIFEEAAKTEINVIFTVVFGGETDDEFIQETIDVVESNGGKVLFVQLTCSKEELEKRVLHESRKEHNKINDLKLLNEVMEKYDLLSPVPQRESLTIDNTNLSPEQTADKIIGHYKLASQGETLRS